MLAKFLKKISRAVGIIKKMQWIFPTEILLAIYTALVLPHIIYCILSWGADSNTKFRLQKKTVKKSAVFRNFFAKHFTGKHSSCNEESETTTSRTFS